MGTNALPAPPTGDINGPADVDELVRRFYRDVAQDDLLGPIFNDVAKVDWAAHLPKLSLFWCRSLFGIAGYHGNPFRQHAQVHAKEPFTTAHFERWLELFHETIDLGWFGPTADRAKELAQQSAAMHHKQLLRRSLNGATSQT